MLDDRVLTKLNYLDPETKILVVHCTTLIEKTLMRQHLMFHDVDLTARLQIRDDISDVEKTIKKMAKGKSDAATVAHLKFAYAKLKTSSEHILRWKYEE